MPYLCHRDRKERTMKNKIVILVIWALGAIVPAGWAQSDMEQAKLDIWTETADFVYRDANLPNPGQFTNVNNLAEFVALIKKEDSNSSIYSKLYKPIEDGGFYKQPRDPKAQLNTLVKSIYARLRTNDQRMNDIKRRRKLDDLHKQLQQIAADYGAPATTGAPIVQDVQNPDSAQSAETFTDPDGTSTDATAEEKLSSLAKREENIPSTSNNYMAILALVLGVINLGLIYLLNQEIKKQSKRIDQRRSDIDNLAQMVNIPGRADGASKITMAAVENLINKAIAQERENLQNIASAGTSAAQRPIKMATQPAIQSPPPVSVALPVTEESPSLEELVAAANPLPPAPPADKPQSKFARIPVNGGFHEQDLYDAPQHDSIYEIRVHPKDPNQAMFRIVTNTNVHRSAIESAYLSLKDACNYQMNNAGATRIVTDKPGTLNHANGFWKIDRKAQVHFE